MAEQKIICITGMERSGTSMVARIVNLLGVSLGPPKKLILETDYNEKGCWESRSLLEISDEILVRLGGSTHEPPELWPGWENSPELVDLEDRAKEVISKDFAGLDIWGWKDPRSSFTLPFWQKLLPGMEYIVCIRNPVDVVNSLLKRKWCSSFTGAFYIWLMYTTSAIRNTAGGRRLVVFYEDFMGEDWASEAGRITEFLGLSSNQLKAAEPEMSAFISKDLRHFGTPLEDTLANPEVPFSVKAYYLSLLALKKDGGTEHVIKNVDNDILLNSVSACADANEMEKKLMKVENILDLKNRQIAALLGSKSWKITAPFRWCLDRVKK